LGGQGCAPGHHVSPDRGRHGWRSCGDLHVRRGPARQARADFDRRPAVAPLPGRTGLRRRSGQRHVAERHPFADRRQTQRQDHFGIGPGVRPRSARRPEFLLFRRPQSGGLAGRYHDHGRRRARLGAYLAQSAQDLGGLHPRPGDPVRDPRQPAGRAEQVFSPGPGGDRPDRRQAGLCHDPSGAGAPGRPGGRSGRA
jgi:hypothetical protein